MNASQSSDDRAPAARADHLRNVALAFASAVLVWLAFPPADLGLVAWVALIPWLVMVSRARPGRAAAWSAAAGVAVFVALLHWLRFVTAAGWLALAVYCGAYWPVAALILGWLKRRRVPFILATPLVLTVMEFARAHLFTGFPFYFLGHSQYARLAVIQIADLTGVYGVTFLIALVNGFVADRIVDRPEPRRRALLACGVAGAVAALALGYGLVRLGSDRTREGPKVCLVQANVPLSLKHSPSLDETFGTLERHVELSKQAIGRGVDLVIWPETMVPGPLNLASAKEILVRIAANPEWKEYADFLERCRAEVVRAATETGSHLLVGAETQVPETGARYNSAYFLSPKGEILGRYDKIHLVVFGEYTPLTQIFPFLKKLRPAVMGPDLSAGKLRWLFDLPSRDGAGAKKFGTTICYEDSEAGLFRQFVRDGADFMVNVTNDGWFRDSSELDHHLSVCVFRAVENRVPIARCANTGISALIAPDGRIAERIVLPDGTYREVEGTLIGRLPMSDHRSFYTAHGDLFAWLCVGGLLIIGATVALRLRRAGTSRRGNP